LLYCRNPNLEGDYIQGDYKIPPYALETALNTYQKVAKNVFDYFEMFFLFHKRFHHFFRGR